MNRNVSLFRQKTDKENSNMVSEKHMVTQPRAARLREYTKRLNTKLAIKEAGSWESARRFVLTD